MIRIILVLLFILTFSPNFSYASSDYEGDYTLIDCLDGNDDTGVEFDSNKPYQTLKAGIEHSITYINENVNIAGNESSASGAVFTIKVNCVASNLLNSNVSLNFNGELYNNDLIIEGVGDNGLIIQNMYFYVPNKTGRITFKNAKFLDNSKYGYYFIPPRNYVYKSKYYDDEHYNVYNFYGISIEDSYVRLRKNTHLTTTGNFRVEYRNCYRLVCGWHTPRYTYTFNEILFHNSVIDVDVDSNYEHNLPFLIKNSKLNFNNTSTGSYNISFINNSDEKNQNNYDNALLLGNEIDFGGNNFISENKTNIAYINNKFSNFNNFNFSAKALYFNNLIENTTELNISGARNLINNIFSGSFIDNYDKNNLRKNYLLEDIGNKGIGWFFSIKSPLGLFNTKMSLFTLYKEVTGQDIQENKQGIYVIYTK